MNTGKGKLLKICQTFLISSAILFSMFGCDSIKAIDTIDSDKDTVISYNMVKDYGYAVGLNYIYIIYGKYQKIPAGIAISLKDKSLHSYRIRDLLTKYPILDSEEAQSAAAEQDKKLKLI